MKKKILLLVAGKTNLSIRNMFGDKTVWFNKIIEDCGAEMKVIEAYKGEKYNETDGDGWIITGSADSVMDQKDWMIYMEDKIIKAQRLGKPILGVCFGHQILAKALGGTVMRNPHGWEVGSHKIVLTNEGKTTNLYKNLPSKLTVYETHQDTVSTLPPNSKLLAKNSMGVQSFMCLGSYGIQFHPEFNFEIMQAYTKLNKSQGIKFKSNENVNTNNGENVMKNFLLNLLDKK